MPIKVRSPVGSFVVAIMTTHGQRVEEGQILLQLDSEDERQEIARLNKFKLLSQESVEQLTGRAAQEKREILNISRTVASSYYSYLKYAYSSAQDRLTVGEITVVDVKQIEAELAEAKAKSEKAEIMITLFEENLSHNLKIAQLTLEHADTELEFAKRKLEETTIKSPSSGTLSLRVGVGSYVKQGGVLGDIKP